VGASQPQLLKRDHLGSISVVAADDATLIERDTDHASFGLRWIARGAAAREARALRALEGLDGVPRLLGFDGRRLRRSWIGGSTMQDARPGDVQYFYAAWRLQRAMRARGVLHNDLAKEANWLVRADGRPAVIDFQLAWVARNPRTPMFRLLARENLRHLLKHKRTCCPSRITPTERRILARRSWITRLWHATGKRLYILIARRILNWEDNEGRGKKGVR
jgi:RIO-like serine/threonine protein kinase